MRVIQALSGAEEAEAVDMAVKLSAITNKSPNMNAGTGAAIGTGGQGRAVLLLLLFILSAHLLRLMFSCQNFSFAGMIGRRDDPLLFHLLNQARRTVIADGKPPLHIAR